MRVVIYTALYGNYYNTFQPLPDLVIDAYAFTDNPNAAAKGWQTVVTPFPDAKMHPRMMAKWFKMFPHKLFPDYDISIWLDAGWKWTEKYPTLALAGCVDCLGENNLCFFPHRRNQTLQQELYETMGLEKYKLLPCLSQVAHYYTQGYHDENPIVECTMLLRQHNEPDAIRFNEAWWRECRDWTFCDQLSAPYVLWKEQIEYSLFPFNLDEQPWFRIAAWRSDR